MEKLKITVNGRSYEVIVEVLESEGSAAALAIPAAQGRALSKDTFTPITATPTIPAPEASTGEYQIKAPMPGTVMEIKVRPGDTVKQGMVLIIFEAMKMENELAADSDGTVKQVHVSEGQSFQSGDPLITLG